MIIGIDASRATISRRTGTEAYAYHLIRGLIPLSAERGHRLRLYFNQAPALELFDRHDHVEQVVIPQQRLWTHVRLRGELQQQPPEVFFTPAHVIPVTVSVPSVATIHDLGYEFFPEAHTARQRAYLRWSTRHNGRIAQTVIADSKATRADLARLYNVDPDKIAVIYPGADSELGPEQDAERLAAAQERYGVRPPYLLYLGTLQPRKNLVRLVEAYAASGLAAEGYTLVLAGKRGWLSESVIASIAALDEATARAVVMPGYIDDGDKAALLTGAMALVFPSLYEGFGFPVLEAQACGTVVVCSNTSSLPEVAGSAALLIDPLDTVELSAAMRRIVSSDSLRDRLMRDGFDNVRRFTWEQTAAAVMDVLENAAQ